MTDVCKNVLRTVFGGQGALFAAMGLFALSAAGADLVVDRAQALGPIKPVNGVNGAPFGARRDQTNSNFDLFRAARFPHARNHDANHVHAFGAPHTVDVSAVFPDFDADENDPKSYDFTNTDAFVKSVVDAGCEPFYRLGESIEHTARKYHAWPPKDFAKWARVCEHIVRHYTEGWADGFRYRITYWEIWNEPDLDSRDDPERPGKKLWQTAPQCWGGSEAQFHDFYATAAKHLKARFPHLKIGGPASAGNLEWLERFVPEMAKRGVPMDFCSWHCYWHDVAAFPWSAKRVRKALDANGYAKTESICSEWNYVRNWNTAFPYSLKAIKSLKGAAFAASVMTLLQKSGVDAAQYYDVRGGGFDGLFDLVKRPLPAYWAFRAWDELRTLGTQVRCEFDGPGYEKDFFPVAAKNAAGKTAILVSRYREQDDMGGPVKIRVRLADGESLKGASLRLMDMTREFLDAPYELDDRGGMSFTLQKHAVALIVTGGRADTVRAWETRRQKTLDWFEDEMYGRAPVGRPADEVIGERSVTCGGGKVKVNIHLSLPAGASKDRPAPVFVMGDHFEPLYSANHTNVYPGVPTNSITGRGYAYVWFNFNDLAPNLYDKQTWSNGVHRVFGDGGEHGWGTLSAWAWGFSRVMDWIETRPELDAKRVAAVGHSRGGKTALWAVAQDGRFRMAVSNNSGAGGAKLMSKTIDYPYSETSTSMCNWKLSPVPFWYARAFAKYEHRDLFWPHQADDLIRLVAPRLCIVASAGGDVHAGPEAEKASVDRAMELYRAMGAEGNLVHLVRPGGHALQPGDWLRFLDFADKHMRAPGR